jgi:hypothetical protein
MKDASPSPPQSDQVEAAQVLAGHPRLLAWLDKIHAAAVGHGVSMASWAAFIGELEAAILAPGRPLTHPADTGVMRPYYVDDVKYETTFSKLLGMQITARIPYFNPVYSVVLEHEPEHPWWEDRVIGPSDWVDIPIGNPAKFYTIPPATFGGGQPLEDPYGDGAPDLPVSCPACWLEITAARCGSAHCPLKDAEAARTGNRRPVAALRPVTSAPEGMREAATNLAKRLAGWRRAGAYVIPDTRTLDDLIEAVLAAAPPPPAGDK